MNSAYVYSEDYLFLSLCRRFVQVPNNIFHYEVSDELYERDDQECIAQGNVFAHIAGEHNKQSAAKQTTEIQSQLMIENVGECIAVFLCDCDDWLLAGFHAAPGPAETPTVGSIVVVA